jgi:hypothetical protein
LFDGTRFNRNSDDLEWVGHQFEHDGLAREGYDLTPLQMFKRQCFFNAWYDPVAPFTDYIGADHEWGQVLQSHIVVMQDATLAAV